MPSGNYFLSNEDLELAQILLRQTNSIDYTSELMVDKESGIYSDSRASEIRKKIIYHIEKGNLLI